MAKKFSFPSCSPKQGLDALPKDHQNKINLKGLTVNESVNIDEYFSEAEPNSNRWDYYIGLKKLNAIYLEVHEVSEEHFDKIKQKAAWLRKKINDLNWPNDDSRPVLIAPTSGIPIVALQTLKNKLALEKIIVVMKGDKIVDVIE